MSKNKKAPAGAGTPTKATETAALGAATISYPNFTTPPKARQVSAYLPIGAGNAIDGKTLSATMGFKTVRELSRQIQRERLAGAPICAAVSGDSRGCYSTDEPAELRRYISALDRRLREIRRTRDACRDTLRRMRGQEIMEGWNNGQAKASHLVEDAIPSAGSDFIGVRR